MKLKWIDATRYSRNTPNEKRGGEFAKTWYAKVDNTVTIYITRLVGLSGWFLRCRAVRLQDHVDLNTDDLEKAKKKAVSLVLKELKRYVNAYNKLSG